MNGELYPQYISIGRIDGLFRQRSIRFCERGQSMVEIALILPIFLIFVFAVMELGRAWSAKQSLTISAREGARILVMPYGLEPNYKYKTEEEVIAAAEKAVKDSMNGSGTPAIDSITEIIPIRIRPGNDGVFNTDDDLRELYRAGLSPPVLRGDRVGIYITYKFETPAPILVRMYDNGGGQSGKGDNGGGLSGKGEINMGVICFMDHE